MSSPLFLTLDQIILFHRKGLDLFGGTDGIRDEGALQSAVAQSLQVYFYANGFPKPGTRRF
jgi:prophage maintenance system killer protein